MTFNPVVWRRRCPKCQWAIIRFTNPFDRLICLCGWSGYLSWQDIGVSAKFVVKSGGNGHTPAPDLVPGPGSESESLARK